MDDDGGADLPPGLRKLLASMSLADKVGQVTQLDIADLLAEGQHLALNVTAARAWAALGVGSFLNSPASGGRRAGVSSPSSEMWRAFLQDLDDVYKGEGKVRRVGRVQGLSLIHI